jgi:glycosyltransferase involved in cell wall biosynthesis
MYMDTPIEVSMKDLFTIIIPCKNEEKYIGHLLDSLSQQVGIGNTRILVADANSTDNTLQVVKLYDDVLNIEVIQGGPVSVGRNNGSKLVTTPYILFLDADVRLFHPSTIYDAVNKMEAYNLDLMTANIKNYGPHLRASFFFWCFNLINKIMTKKTPFAIGAFFLTRKDKFDELGGFPNKYETSEDYILSKQYDPKKFMILDHYFGQDERRFTKLGYTGMIWYMVVNFLNRNNLKHFEKAKVNYWN